MRDIVLLVGNDINSISQGHYSWQALLIELIRFVGADGRIDTNEKKPFPLLYEEINLEAQKNQIRTEKEIREKIAWSVGNLRNNEIHQEIIDLRVNNILTTNFDLTLESVLEPNTKSLENSGIVKESSFSLFRRNKIGNTNFWHIHGDSNYSQSIILGFGRYGDYLQKLRDYIVTGTKDNYKDYEFLPMSKRLKNNLLKYDSWVDFFFTKDVFIFGLRLDFIEIHLWWLLTIRARFKQDKEIHLRNRIYYFYPEQLKKEILHKLQMFDVYGITAISCDKPGEKDSSAHKYYRKVLKKIRESI